MIRYFIFLIIFITSSCILPTEPNNSTQKETKTEVSKKDKDDKFPTPPERP